jgi:hypothetical protein
MTGSGSILTSDIDLFVMGSSLDEIISALHEALGLTRGDIGRVALTSSASGCLVGDLFDLDGPVA